MSSPIVDQQYWPLVISIMPKRIEESDLGPFLRTHQELLERRERYSVVSDLSAVAHVPGARERQMIAEWTERLDPLMRLYSVCSTIVVASPLVRGALTALHWLSPPPYPIEVVPTRLAAVDAILEIYARVGEPVPASFARCRNDVARGSFVPVAS